MTTPPITEIAAIAELARETVSSHTFNGVELFTVHNNASIVSGERLAKAPLRENSHVLVAGPADFMRYIAAQTQGYDDPHIAIFANRKDVSLTAFLDYHRPDGPSWLDRSVKVQYAFSQRLLAWRNLDGKNMDQAEFGDFLDEHQNDVINPSGADLLSFATKLEATSTVVFKGSVKLATGETKYTFHDERSGETDTKIIDTFTLGLPLWERGGPVKIEARLYHRIVEVKEAAGTATGARKLVFSFKLRQINEIIDAVWDETLEDLKHAAPTGCHIYQGTGPAAPTVTAIK